MKHKMFSTPRASLASALFAATLAAAGLPPAAQAQPTISSLSASALPQAGRLKIAGSEFGAQPDGGARVTIGGVTAPVSAWSDTAITAYVPDSAPLGSDAVQVVTPAGASNAATLGVTARPAPAGHVKWRFQADGYYIIGRPAVGADGTVYAADNVGHLYALSPAGGVKWIFNATPGNVTQPVSVGSDGTIYFASLATIYAVRPDGTLKWKFTDPGFALIFAGPTAGPDGNIYAVSSDLNFPNGLGAFVLSPAGTKLANLSGFSTRLGYAGIEIVFSSGHWYFTNNASGAITSAGSLWAFNLGGATQVWHQSAERQPRLQPGSGNLVVGDGNPVHPGLKAFDPNGALLWAALGEGTGTDAVTDVDTGSDGAVFLGTLTYGTGSHFRALNANGTQRWKFRDDDTATRPAVSPTGDLVLYSAAGYNAPSHVNALNTATGQLLWRENLPVEDGGNIQVMSTPRFATDGSTAYVGTVVNATSDKYCYLYAFITGSAGPYAADGIDDAWQVQHFGANNPQAADPNADPDGDGRTNLQEYLAGTVPTDAASRFSMQVQPVPGGQPGQMQIVFSPRLADRTYVVEYAEMPASAGGAVLWETLTGAVSDNGNVRTVVDAHSATAGSCLYRVRITKP